MVHDERRKSRGVETGNTELRPCPRCGLPVIVCDQCNTFFSTTVW